MWQTPKDFLAPYILSLTPAHFNRTRQAQKETRLKKIKCSWESQVCLRIAEDGGRHFQNWQHPCLTEHQGRTPRSSWLQSFSEYSPRSTLANSGKKSSISPRRFHRSICISKKKQTFPSPAPTLFHQLYHKTLTGSRLLFYCTTTATSTRKWLPYGALPVVVFHLEVLQRTSLPSTSIRHFSSRLLQEAHTSFGAPHNVSTHP